jgi:hypothetical protein
MRRRALGGASSSREGTLFIDVCASCTLIVPCGRVEISFLVYVFFRKRVHKDRCGYIMVFFGCIKIYCYYFYEKIFLPKYFFGIYPLRGTLKNYFWIYLGPSSTTAISRYTPPNSRTFSKVPEGSRTFQHTKHQSMPFWTLLPFER